MGTLERLRLAVQLCYLELLPTQPHYCLLLSVLSVLSLLSPSPSLSIRGGPNVSLIATLSDGQRLEVDKHSCPNSGCTCLVFLT